MRVPNPQKYIHIYIWYMYHYSIYHLPTFTVNKYIYIWIRIPIQSHEILSMPGLGFFTFQGLSCCFQVSKRKSWRKWSNWKKTSLVKLQVFGRSLKRFGSCCFSYICMVINVWYIDINKHTKYLCIYVHLLQNLIYTSALLYRYMDIIHGYHS